MGKINVVFDIDGVLVCINSEERSNTPHAKLFEKHGAIIKAYGCPHYVIPGIIELLSHLCSLENVRVSFFSSGIKERNEELIEKLLTKALGSKEAYEHYQPLILSRESLNPLERTENQYGAMRANMFGKKDITRVLGPDDDIKNVIFIDDNPIWVRDEQIPNWIPVQPVFLSRYDNLAIPEWGEFSDSAFGLFNSAFYLAGFIDKCIDNASTATMSEQILQQHFGKAGEKYTPLPEVFRYPEYYYLGRKILELITPDLPFTTPETLKNSRPFEVVTNICVYGDSTSSEHQDKNPTTLIEDSLADSLTSDQYDSGRLLSRRPVITISFGEDDDYVIPEFFLETVLEPILEPEKPLKTPLSGDVFTLQDLITNIE
ncbi:MAG: NIF family HAD-type phosphatase [Pseudomonadota bacterium]